MTLPRWQCYPWCWSPVAVATTSSSFCVCWVKYAVWRVPSWVFCVVNSCPHCLSHRTIREDEKNKREPCCSVFLVRRFIDLAPVHSWWAFLDSKQLRPPAWNSEPGAFYLHLRPTLTGVMCRSTLCVRERESDYVKADSGMIPLGGLTLFFF